mmetsp:Transcript_15276/g.41850  ORF Transcript_15276/g.41850 Transcript_15276/m.41850 type:complete len:243 (+) Transcript_15276:80-808(+)
MVIPIGGAGGGGFDLPPESMEAPRSVKEHYVIYWWAAMTIFMLTCVCRLAAMDVGGGFTTGIMAFITYYLIKNDCQQMSQCCVLYFTVMCAMNCVLELIPLLTSLGGRTLAKRGNLPSEKGTTVYTITMEKHPFFDQSMGNYYNFQSCVMIVVPVVMLLGVALGYFTYGQYATSLFNQDDSPSSVGGVGPGSGGGHGYGGGYGGYGGYGTGGHGRGGPAGHQGRRTNTVPVFEGQGQRLGSA